jgi:hypothetical protein
MENPVDYSGNGEEKSHQRAGSAYIEKSACCADWRANEDESAEGAIDIWKGNEEGIARPNVMMAAGEKVAQFVGEKDGEKSEREGQSRSETRGVLVEERESAKKFVEGCRFPLIERNRELRAGDQAGAKGEEE